MQFCGMLMPRMPSLVSPLSASPSPFPSLSPSPILSLLHTHRHTMKYSEQTLESFLKSPGNTTTETNNSRLPALSPAHFDYLMGEGNHHNLIWPWQFSSSEFPAQSTRLWVVTVQSPPTQIPHTLPTTLTYTLHNENAGNQKETSSNFLLNLELSSVSAKISLPAYVSHWPPRNTCRAKQNGEKCSEKPPKP